MRYLKLHRNHHNSVLREVYKYGVFSGIWIEYGKIWTRINSVFGHLPYSVSDPKTDDAFCN